MVRVVYSDDTARIGQYVEITLQKVKNNAATCDLLFYEKTLRGTQKYDVAPATETQAAVTAALPMFKKHKVNTTITTTLGSWLPMGGLIGEKTEPLSSEKTVKTKTNISTWTRILPPKTMPTEPSATDGQTTSGVDLMKSPTTPATGLETTNLHSKKPTLRFVLASGVGKLFEPNDSFFETLNGTDKGWAFDDWSHFSAEPLKGTQTLPLATTLPLALEKVDTTYTELFSAPLNLGEEFSSADGALKGTTWQETDFTTPNTI